jgi:hypothetical protein
MCGRASADAVLNRPDSPIGASTINLAAQTKDEGYLGSTAAFIGSSVHEHAQTCIIILRSIRTVIGRSGRIRICRVGPEGRLSGWLKVARLARPSWPGAAMAELQGLALGDRFWREGGSIGPACG